MRNDRARGGASWGAAHDRPLPRHGGGARAGRTRRIRGGGAAGGARAGGTRRTGGAAGAGGSRAGGAGDGRAGGPEGGRGGGDLPVGVFRWRCEAPAPPPAACACGDAPGYARTAANELELLFPRLPNPDVFIYVPAHLATELRIPVPGYTTAVPLYDRVEYALPGETQAARRLGEALPGDGPAEARRGASPQDTQRRARPGKAGSGASPEEAQPDMSPGRPGRMRTRRRYSPARARRRRRSGRVRRRPGPVRIRKCGSARARWKCRRARARRTPGPTLPWRSRHEPEGRARRRLGAGQGARPRGGGA